MWKFRLPGWRRSQCDHLVEQTSGKRLITLTAFAVAMTRTLQLPAFGGGQGVHAVLVHLFEEFVQLPVFLDLAFELLTLLLGATALLPTGEESGTLHLLFFRCPVPNWYSLARSRSP